jgi:hypothetical protein
MNILLHTNRWTDRHGKGGKNSYTKNSIQATQAYWYVRILLNIIVFESVEVPVCEQYLTFPPKLKWVSAMCVCHIRIIDATSSLRPYSPLRKCERSWFS